jgi:TPR repeat protein
MGFKIFCTNCGQKLEAEEEHIGHSMPCPVCNESIDITKPRSLGVADPEVEKADSSWAENTRGKIEDLKNKTQAAVESITNSEKASELKENLKKLGKRGGDAAASTADTLSKSAKIGGLQAKIKKLESINLRNALLELGEKCFLAGTIKEIEPELYTELERLRKEIDESNDRGLPEMATLGSTEQLRRLALKAQLKIQEENLKRKYREKLIELGKKSLGTVDASRDFKELTEYIGSLKKQIQEANESIDSLGKGVHKLLKRPWAVGIAAVLVLITLWRFNIGSWVMHTTKPQGTRLSPSSYSGIKTRNPNNNGLNRLNFDTNSFISCQPFAEKGDPIAQYSLGQLYFNGKGGCKRDWDKGEYWTKKSANQGYEEAKFTLGLYKIGFAFFQEKKFGSTPEQKMMLEEGIKIMTELASNGNQKAEVELAICKFTKASHYLSNNNLNVNRLSESDPVRIDFEKSVDIIIDAAKEKNQRAIDWLKEYMPNLLNSL